MTLITNCYNIIINVGTLKMKLKLEFSKKINVLLQRQLQNCIEYLKLFIRPNTCLYFFAKL